MSMNNNSTTQRIPTVDFTNKLHVNDNARCGLDDDDGNDRSFMMGNIGGGMGGSRNQFEKARVSMSSSMTSHFPHVLAQRLPTIGPDSFPQWFSPIYVFVAYIMMFIFEGTIYSFLISSAFSQIPGTDPASILLKAMITAGTSMFVVVGFARWSGGYCDPFITMMVGFMEIFFNDKWKDYRSYGIMQKGLVIFKILVACLFNFIGFLVGFALNAAHQSGPIITSDCFVEFSPTCLTQPKPFFVNDQQAQLKVLFGSLLIPAAFLIAYGLNKKRELWTLGLTYTGVHYSAKDQNGDADGLSKDDLKRQKRANKMYVPYEINDDYIQIAFLVAAAHFCAVGLFSRDVGFGFNFYYWVVSSIFTGDYSHAVIYAWPMLVSCIMVFIVHTVWYLNSDRSISYRRRKFEELAAADENLFD